MMIRDSGFLLWGHPVCYGHEITPHRAVCWQQRPIDRIAILFIVFGWQLTAEQTSY